MCTLETLLKKIILTASGGPFINLPKNKFKNIKPKDALKHPNWKMGKKITIDSSTLMNKVFEVIEARNIFDIKYKKISILIHPKSYIHAIVKFRNGLSKILIHEPNMKIPIFNTLYDDKKFYQKSKNINIKKLNNLNLEKPNLEKFPLIKILKKIPNKFTLYEALIVSINDTLVELFLDKKIQFKSISRIFFNTINDKDFLKYKSIIPKNIDQIINLKNLVQKKIKSIYI